MITDRNFRKLYFLIAIAFTVIFAIVYSQYRHFVTQNALEESSRQKVLLYKVYSEIQNAETSQRGYLLTKDSLYRRSIEEISKKVFFQLGGFANTTKPNTQESEDAQKLMDLSSSKLSELSYAMKLVDDGFTDQALENLKTDKGELLMNKIDVLVKKMLQDEQQSIQKILEDQKTYEKLIFFFLVLFIFIGLYIIYNIASQLVPIVNSLEQKNDTLTANNKIKEIEIAKRKKADKRNDALIKTLKEKNKELNHFAYIASHDLQEPLRTVSNFIDILKEEYPELLEKEDTVQYLNFIDSATVRMKGLIEGLLRYSRIGKSGNFQLTDMNELVYSVEQNLMAQIKAKKAKVIVKKLPELMILPLEIQQLFQNLISNSLKFISKERSPEIIINCELKDENYEFSLQDNGIGIKREHQSKIFDMFTRLHSEHAFEGRWLGLSFCKKIIELHGGKIWVESIPNMGSSFFFTIKSNLTNEKA